MDITIDLNVNKWPLADQFAFREKAGATPQYAVIKIGEIAAESTDSDDGELPDGFFNIPAEWLVAFSWVARRQAGERIPWSALVDELDASEEGAYNSLLVAVFSAFVEMATDAAADAEPEPDPTVPDPDDGAATGSPRTKTSSDSAASTAGRKPTSSRSRRTSTKPQ